MSEVTLNDFKGYVIDDIVLIDDDFILEFELSSQTDKKRLRLKVEPVGRFCDDIWLTYSAEIID